MIKFIKYILGLCNHKWEIIRTTTIYSEFDKYGEELPIAKDFTLQCKKCGNLKRKRI